MGAFAYMSQKVETVAPKIERRLRKEIGSDAPLSYTIESGEAHAASVGTLLGDVGAALAHKERGAPFLFRLDFQLPPPRPTGLRVSVARQGFGCYVASLLYSTHLRKSVAGEVSFEESSDDWRSKPRFVGDAETAERLNADRNLIKHVNLLTFPWTQLGSLKISIRRFCTITPADGGALLTAAALPRAYWLGFRLTGNAKEFLEVASMIEAVL
jgi:hypothetical protein